MQENRKRVAFGLLLALVFAFLAYAPSLRNGFTMDDRLVAVGINDSGQPNERIHELQPLSVYIGSHYGADTEDAGRLYRPLTVLSYALRHHFFGDDPRPAHAFNLLLHLIAVLLVYRLLLGLGASTPGRLVGALVFAMHAIHSEVVANVVGRAELLAFVFGAAAVLCVFPVHKKGAFLTAVAALFAGVFLFLAFCAKESALAWVPFAFVYGLAKKWQAFPAPVGRDELVHLLVRTAAVSVPGLLVFFYLRHQVLAGLPGDPAPVAWIVNPIAEAPVGTRLMTATTVLGYGLALCLAPFRLAADYGAQVFPILNAPTPIFIVVAAVLVLLVLAGLWFRRRHPALFVAMAAFFGFSFLTSNLAVPIGTIFGERLFYAPSLGVAFLAAWIFGHERIALARTAFLIAGLWVGASTLVVLQRNRVWQDDQTLFLHEARSQPRSVRMQLCAATINQGLGRPDAAIRHLQASLELDPEYALGWNNLGAILLDLGRLEEAEAAIRKGLAAQHIDEGEDRFKLRCNLGLILKAKEKPQEAATEFEAALALAPDFYRAFHELDQLRVAKALEPADLARRLERCRQENPKAEAHWKVYEGILAHFEGKFSEAEAKLGPGLQDLGSRPRAATLRSQGRFSRGYSLFELGHADEAKSVLQALAEDRFASPERRAEARKLLEAKKGG